MDDKYNLIVPPHLNAQVYKNDTAGNRAISYLDYIKQHKDGTVIIGSSELTGRYWDGGASLFKSISEARNIKDQEKRCINLTSGTSDGCFLDSSNKVILCEDSGAVSIWSMNNEDAWQMWSEEFTYSEHDGAALAIDCLKPGAEYVTVGADGNAKVWDINMTVCLRTYEAHTMATYALAVRPQSNNTFATGSYDEHISLWNDNTRKPELDLLKNDCGIRTLQWLNENQLVYGDEAGILSLLDLRNTGEKIKLTEFPAPIHKIVVNPLGDKLAVCCDNTIVSVCEITENTTCNIVYHDRHMHSNFVRGFAWDVDTPNLLHAVGWNTSVSTHTIA